VPRCGIFTDVDDENLKKNFPKGYLLDDKPSSIPTIKLKNSNGILENSINQVFFLRNIKTAKEKSINDLFDLEKLTQLMVFFSPNIDIEEKQVNKGKMPDSVIKLEEFRSICVENFGLVVDDETLEIIFHHFNISLNNVTIDFELFVRLFYLIGKKAEIESEEANFIGEEISGIEEQTFKKKKWIKHMKCKEMAIMGKLKKIYNIFYYLY